MPISTNLIPPITINGDPTPTAGNLVDHQWQWRRLIQRISSRKNTTISLSSIKDLDFRSSDGVYRLVTERETAPFVDEKKKPDYYANTGYAIRILREEILDLFYRELSFDIYRDDIIFKDPINAFAGINKYKSILWSLRFHGRIFFRALWIDIVRVWQPTEKENTIMVRWTVHGIPRTPWESRSRFDGTSEYKLDKDGKIYEHKVDNIALNGLQNFQFLAVEQLASFNNLPSHPKTQLDIDKFVGLLLKYITCLCSRFCW